MSSDQMEAVATPQNDDDVGENVVADEDTGPSNAVTVVTPVASRAIIQDFAGESSTPEASASLIPSTPPSPNSSVMLREWATHPNNFAQLQHLPNISSPMPPVAPAELIIQREGSANSAATVDATRASNAYQYPVATFVTNLVRSVSENVREEFRGIRAPCGIPAGMPAEPYSTSRGILDATAAVTTVINDNNGVSNTSAVPIMPPAPPEVVLQTNNASNSNLNVADFEDSNHQWTTLDNGEMVRIDYTHEGDWRSSDDHGESMLSREAREDLEYMQKHDNRNTKSSRIQRSVRGLRRVTRRILRGPATKKKGDKNKPGRGESVRRSRENNSSLGFESHGSTEYNDYEASIELSISENHRLRRDTASDDDNESGDGGSIIEAPNTRQFSSITVSANNSNYEGESSTLANQIRSEELSVRTESHRSTFSGPSNHHSPGGSGNNQGQKKKPHRLPRWLRGGQSPSASSGSGSSVQKRSRRKHPPSSLPTNPGDIRSTSTNSFQHHLNYRTSNDSELNTGGGGFAPTGPMTDGMLSASDPPLSGQSFMPSLREISGEYSASSFQGAGASSRVAESPLHSPPLSTGSNGDLHGLSRPSLDANDFQASSSIAAHASFVGNADSIAVLPESDYYIEAQLDEYDKYDDKSMKGTKNGIKGDKHFGPSIDTMLERAGEIATSMRDADAPLKLPPSPAKSSIRKGKSDGESVPLSLAHPDDDVVHNDTMKLVLVGDSAVDKSGLGRLLRETTKNKAKRPRTLAVDVQEWTPANTDVRFTVWDVLTPKKKDPYLPNFGAHPGTQSLFFSDRSLYLLVYDLGVNNQETLHQPKKPYDLDSDDEDSDDDEWEGHYSDFNREQANRRADRALEADIKERVLSWIDCIARSGTHSKILPIGLLPSNMTMEEVGRRLRIMKNEIEKHERKFPLNVVRPEIESNIACVSLHDQILEDLESKILDVADASLSHRNPVLPGTVEIMNACRNLKKDHKKKMILVDHLVAHLPKNPEFSKEAVVEVLKFLATIGEVLYFGDSDFVLKDHVILCRKWLVGALECILRNNLKKEVSDARDFLRWQAFYSDEQFPESHVTETFTGSNSSCPILSHQDTQILWQSTNFMMEAVDQSSQRSEDTTTMSAMFDFLQHLLEHTGVLLPLEIDRFSSADKIYFVPSLLPQESSRDVWTYKCSESWMVTLSHTWLFRDGAPVGLMEQVAVALLRDLYESCHARADTPTRHGNQQRSRHHLERAHTFPFAPSSMTDFVESHEGEPIGQIKIHQINCWKNSVLIKIGRIFPQENELRESTVEIFVALTDLASPHCVASDVMKSDMQRLVVSGKGQIGLHGQKLWKGGYNIVLDSIKASVANCKNVERQVVCPECLAVRPICNASTWSWDSVFAASDDTVRCMMGHKADRHLICGTAPVISKADDGGKTGNTGDKKRIKDLLSSVVLIALWDNETKTIQNVGSGFIANKKSGLIVTASHILLNMETGNDFGKPRNNLRDFRAIIGIIPDAEKNNTTAVFRYFAKIVAHDVRNMDACILKITARLKNDVQNHSLIGEQPERCLESIQEESLPSLKTTSRFEIEQAVRIIGFNQGGEGRLEVGHHVNRTSDFAPGLILGRFVMDDESTSSDDSSVSDEGELKPREEIIVGCRTITGHSGGPCVNDDGKVIGILSRSDPADSHRCYLVPWSEIKPLIKRAKDRVDTGF